MAACTHSDGFVPGPADFGGPWGAQNLCCKSCGKSQREIASDAQFAAHMTHVRAGHPWQADCNWCPEKQPGAR
jgi:hypothetical protein